MPTPLLGFFVFALCTVPSILGLLVVRRRVEFASLKENNEVAGFLIAIVGVAYAVLLAFVVIAVWERFETARSYSEREANQIINIYRLAPGLPVESGLAIQDLARQYAVAVIEEEWPAMGDGKVSPRAWNLTGDLWQAFGRVEPRSDREMALYQESLNRMAEFADNRRLRLLASHDAVPILLWVVMIGGGVLTVAFTYFFGVKSLRMHVLMTLGLSVSIALSLFLVLALNDPFRGDVRVRPDAFMQAIELFDSASNP